MLSTLKDGIDNVVIQFDAPEPVYQAGKPITGKWQTERWLSRILPFRSGKLQLQWLNEFIGYHAWKFVRKRLHGSSIGLAA